MADVKWIKITTDIFDDEKVLMIESMPSADSIIVIWFKLLTFAGKQNNDGVFLMSNRIAYTDEMLASIFRRDVNTVRLALKAFEQFGMIEIIDNVITIPNWNKHQTLDAYEKKKQRDRLYQQERRAAQRALIGESSDKSSDTSSDVVVSDKDKELDIEEERDIDTITVSKDTVCRTDVQRIINAWNDLGVSTVSKLTPNTKRYNNLRSRIRDYGTDSILKAIDNIRQSDFLMGRKGDGWRITFDWFVLPNNFPKVLDGNYSNKEGGVNRGASSTNDTARLGESIGTWL